MFLFHKGSSCLYNRSKLHSTAICFLQTCINLSNIEQIQQTLSIKTFLKIVFYLQGCQIA